MDYSQVCQGWIYCIENRVNGKKYIGQTINYNQRKHQHFHKKENSPILAKAFNKYGKNNFNMYPILSFNTINRKVCKQILNALEILYIEKYNTYHCGYNANKGGGSQYGFALSKESRKKISESLKGRKLPQETREKCRKVCIERKQWKHTEKPVLQYDLDGNFISEYNSTINASIAVTGKKINHSNITQAAKGFSQKAHGFMWKYKESENYPLHIQPYLDPHAKVVYHYSKDGVLMKKYRGAVEAARILGISRKTINLSCRTSKGHRHRCDYWSYEAPVV